MFLRRLATVLLWILGWKYEGELPEERRFVLISWPHTSNWDAFILCFLAVQQGVPLRWMVKQQALDSPIGWLARYFGAVGIDRSKRNSVVQQMVDHFDANDDFVLAVPPEGTRGRTERWRSGFYRIALGAGVPVYCGYLDYARRRGGCGLRIELRGDVRRDMCRIREHYEAQGYVAKFPEQVGPIVIQDEITNDAAA